MRAFAALALIAVLNGAAAQEKTVVLYTSLAPTESRPLAAAFEKKSGIKVELWRALSENVLQRALSEARAGRNAVDVIETNGPEMETLAREHVLTELNSPHVADLPPAVVPRHRRWAADRLDFFVVAYNTRKVHHQQIPADYHGFLDPKWKGRLGLEATDSEWMAALVKLWGEREGMDFFRRLADLRPDMRKGHVLLAELIAAGEIQVGLTVYNGNAETFKRKGAPIDWVAVNPVVARPQGIGIARNAPHGDAARAFVDFVLSPEGQQLYASMGRTPASTKVETPMNRLKYTLVDPAAVLDEQDKWTREWDKLFNQK
jgi:iron(III) transport system substrate-binding protein